jgi:predicted peroxiredoxin
MNKQYLRLLSLPMTIVLLATAAYLWQPTAPAQDAAPQKIVVNLKHYRDDLHATYMALGIATGLASAGADVTIFANLEGILLTDNGAEHGLVWGQKTMTIGEAYDQFLAAGGHVLACPHCAEAAGISSDRLREGSVLATHDEVVALFLAADKVIDY